MMDPVDADLNRYHREQERLDELSEEWQAEVDEEVERRVRLVDVRRWTRQDADAYANTAALHERDQQDDVQRTILSRLLRELIIYRGPASCITGEEQMAMLYEHVNRVLRECARTWITYAVEDETPRPET